MKIAKQRALWAKAFSHPATDLLTRPMLHVRPQEQTSTAQFMPSIFSFKPSDSNSYSGGTKLSTRVSVQGVFIRSPPRHLPGPIARHPFCLTRTFWPTLERVHTAISSSGLLSATMHWSVFQIRSPPQHIDCYCHPWWKEAFDDSLYETTGQYCWFGTLLESKYHIKKTTGAICSIRGWLLLASYRSQY